MSLNGEQYQVSVNGVLSSLVTQGAFSPGSVDEVIEFAKNCDENSASKIGEYWHLIPRDVNGYLSWRKDINKISLSSLSLINGLDRDDLGDYLYILATSLLACKIIDESFFDCDSTEIVQKLQDFSKGTNEFDRGDRDVFIDLAFQCSFPALITGLVKDGFDLNPDNVEFDDEKDFIKWFFAEYREVVGCLGFFKSIPDEDFKRLFKIDLESPTRGDVLKMVEKINSAKLSLI